MSFDAYLGTSIIIPLQIQFLTLLQEQILFISQGNEYFAPLQSMSIQTSLSYEFSNLSRQPIFKHFQVKPSPNLLLRSKPPNNEKTLFKIENNQSS